MRRALVVVDYQVDFVTGSLGFEKAKNLEAVIVKKLHDASLRGDAIFMTQDTHTYEAYVETREGRHLPILHTIEGTSGHAFYGDVAAFVPEATVFTKDRFASLALGEALSEYDHIEFCGVVSHLCVLSNLIVAQAFNRDATFEVDLNAIASPDPIVESTIGHYLKSLHVKVK